MLAWMPTGSFAPPDGLRNQDHMPPPQDASVVNRPIAPGANSESSAPLGSRRCRELFLCADWGTIAIIVKLQQAQLPIPMGRTATPLSEQTVVNLDVQVMENLQYAANLFFVWIGFGTVVGLLAKAIMPGPDPGGAIATMAMGVVGTVIGCGIVSFFFEGHAVTPISPVGFGIGTAGAFIILCFYRLLAGYWFVEGGHHHPRMRPRRPHYQRRRRSYSYLDDR